MATPKNIAGKSSGMQGKSGVTGQNRTGGGIASRSRNRSRTQIGQATGSQQNMQQQGRNQTVLEGRYRLFLEH